MRAPGRQNVRVLKCRVRPEGKGTFIAVTVPERHIVFGTDDGFAEDAASGELAGKIIAASDGAVLAVVCAFFDKTFTERMIAVDVHSHIVGLTADKMIEERLDKIVVAEEPLVADFFQHALIEMQQIQRGLIDEFVGVRILFENIVAGEFIEGFVRCSFFAVERGDCAVAFFHEFAPGSDGERAVLRSHRTVMEGEFLFVVAEEHGEDRIVLRRKPGEGIDAGQKFDDAFFPIFARGGGKVERRTHIGVRFVAERFRVAPGILFIRVEPVLDFLQIHHDVDAVFAAETDKIIKGVQRIPVEIRFRFCILHQSFVDVDADHVESVSDEVADVDVDLFAVRKAFRISEIDFIGRTEEAQRFVRLPGKNKMSVRIDFQPVVRSDRTAGREGGNIERRAGFAPVIIDGPERRLPLLAGADRKGFLPGKRAVFG